MAQLPGISRDTDQMRVNLPVSRRVLGVTVVISVGLYRLQRKLQSDSIEVPLHMASVMAYVLREMENTNHVLLSVVPKELAPTLLDEARAVMGDLLEPNHGVAFVVPLNEAIGVRQPED